MLSNDAIVHWFMAQLDADVLMLLGICQIHYSPIGRTLSIHCPTIGLALVLGDPDIINLNPILSPLNMRIEVVHLESDLIF